MTERARAVHDALLERYGSPDPPAMSDALSHLVRTILSQNTTDTNRDGGYRGLVEAFPDPGGEDVPDWGAIEQASHADVADAIARAGLKNQKARRIQRTLEAIRTHRGADPGDPGAYDLAFLGDLTTEGAMNWLTGIKGVGAKTASIVLLFDFGVPVFPVDTHVHRVGQRFGLLPEGVTRERAHGILGEAVPDELKYTLHKLLIEHGRTVCKARGALCAEDDVCRRFHVDAFPVEA